MGRHHRRMLDMTPTTSPSAVVGLFVGGSSRRMGGIPKGLLRVSDQSPTLVQRLVEVSRVALGSQTRCVLVGLAPAYEGMALPMLADTPAGIGPLGGLAALIAEGRSSLLSHVYALACDLPYADAALLTRLAHAPSEAAAVAPKQDGFWQPLFARYSVATCEPVVTDLIAHHQLSLQRVFEALGSEAHEMPLNDSEAAQLLDWDSPEDISRSQRR